MSWTERTEYLLGREGLDKLRAARVAVFGLGGVGSYAAEALVRAGVGHLTFIDGDAVAESNLNRQLVALRSTLGQNKAQVMARRALDIAPELDVAAIPAFYTAESQSLLDLSAFDYVADCIDMVSAKLLIIEKCHALGVPVISAMGAGNRLDPTAFRVLDLFETAGDPLARVMRRELRRRGVEQLTVVFSVEEPVKVSGGLPGDKSIGSAPFVPGAAGLALAGRIIRDLAGR